MSMKEDNRGSICCGQSACVLLTPCQQECSCSLRLSFLLWQSWARWSFRLKLKPEQWQAIKQLSIYSVRHFTAVRAWQRWEERISWFIRSLVVNAFVGIMCDSLIWRQGSLSLHLKVTLARISVRYNIMQQMVYFYSESRLPTAVRPEFWTCTITSIFETWTWTLCYYFKFCVLNLNAFTCIYM